MKIKALSRSTQTYLPPGTGDTSRTPRNLDPALHPFEKAREYTRALTATKMERMFAKPFLGQLGDGHIDGVYSLAKDIRNLNRFASGSGDGVVKMWDLSSQEEILSVKAHEGIVWGLCFATIGAVGGGSEGEQRILTCAADKSVKLWDAEVMDAASKPLMTYLGLNGFNSVTHHRKDRIFATGSGAVDIWDVTRSKPVSTLTWGADTINAVRFNMVETSVLASVGTDRTLTLYDIRTNSPVTKLVTTLRTNNVCWNPMEAFNLATASEDHNVYIFDTRNLKRAINVLKDHVAAVMDVDYSPTGEEIVTASYDRTIRIFNARSGHSRDIYHTKRMQRVFQAKFSVDSRYILSGSDDGNVRLWRTKASDRSHVRSAKERAKLEYDEALKTRYQHMPEIKRIARHRHVPKPIKKAGEIKKIELESIKRKEENRRRHEKKLERRRRVPEREKVVLHQEE
ncbi:U3 small nucleolar RNA associated protein [Ascobolus immersus RN42]|uniref:U3 small nucleolar RNA associated protein n=1 Tax=Ascobolus immersus RN42 TaxID=1160509 RepID=A0A3N4HIV1_ASCIM|nr:U3 small nucleolar RNA associated protein [Ascobolus immersus RN42]